MEDSVVKQSEDERAPSRGSIRSSRSTARSRSSLRRETDRVRKKYDKVKEDNERQRKEIEAQTCTLEMLTQTIKTLEEQISEMRKEQAQDRAERQAQTAAAEPMETSGPCSSGKKRAAPSSSDESSRPAYKKTTEQVSTMPVKNTNPVISTANEAPRIPPIVLRKKETWSGMSKQLTNNKIQYTKAKLVEDGIQVHPASVEDYRSMVQFLTAGTHEYHTYTLPEDRQLRVVMRGLPDGITSEEIREDLEAQGLKINEVLRMTSRRTKRSMPLVLIKLPQDQEQILQVSRCCFLVVRVERQRAAQGISQCFRCQRFGHAQSRCTAKAACVRCGLSHHSRECTKDREIPARCANCEGPHPANYRGCPRCPKPLPKKPAQTSASNTAGTSRAQPAAKRSAAKSFADAAKTGKSTNSISPPANQLTAASLAAAMTQMQQMFTMMTTLFAQMPAIPTS